MWALARAWARRRAPCFPQGCADPRPAWGAGDLQLTAALKGAVEPRGMALRFRSKLMFHTSGPSFYEEDTMTRGHSEREVAWG